jgi:hypothetical protein
MSRLYVQVTEEASSSQKRPSNTSKHEFFLLLWVIFALLDPDPYSNYGSVSGSNGPIEYGSNTDPDPGSGSGSTTLANTAYIPNFRHPSKYF